MPLVMTGDIKPPRVASIGILGRSGSRRAIDKERFFIGRDGHCDMIVDDNQASRKHVLIQKGEGGFYLSDLGSRNGVTINDRRIGDGEKVALHDADCIGLGTTVLVYREGRDVLSEIDDELGIELLEEPVRVAYGGDTEDEIPSHVDIPAADGERPVPPAAQNPPPAQPRRESLDREVISLEGEVRFWKLCALILAISCAVMLTTLFTERYGSRGEVIRYELPPSGQSPQSQPAPQQPAQVAEESSEVALQPALNLSPEASLRVVGPVRLGHAVRVSASQSLDPEGMPLLYHWSLAALPDGSRTFLTAEAGLARFIPDRVGTYLVGLTVEDQGGLRADGQLEVRVELLPDERMRGPDLLELSLNWLGRPPVDEDWLVLDSLPRAQLIDRVFTREAVLRSWLELEVERLGCRVRPPAVLLESLLDRLMRAELALPDATAEILLDGSFVEAYSDRDYVTHLLQVLIGRVAELQPTTVERGLELLQGHPVRFMGSGGKSRQDFVQILVEHQDFNLELGRYLAGRFALPSDAALVAALRARDLRSGWVQAALEQPPGAEVQRAQTAFLRRLHFDLFGFDAGQDVLADLLAPFAVGEAEPTRRALARLLVSSPQLPVGRVDIPWVRAKVQSCLGRDVGDEEARAVMRSAGGGVDAMRWILHAIVTSREYLEL